jgi:hypothetical protein
LVIERNTEGEYLVPHARKSVYSSNNKALVDANFEALRDELQASTGEDPMARVREELSRPVDQLVRWGLARDGLVVEQDVA